ncbi:hypothetical protein [Streptomyces sp. KL110A]|uniref:hypothetical protein n=1 Tax=Streptomyces sp. KL110A TaxID=3384221 RepID=UPI0038C75A62
MTRRMMGNSRNRNTLHGVEHDEIDACRVGSPCEPFPVPAERGVTVTVPLHGTAIVIDGVVQEPTSTGRSTYANTISYTFNFPKPKPEFFEPGKVYTRFIGWSIRAQASDVTERFECTAVEKDGDSRPVAFGRLTTDKGGRRDLGVDLWYLFHDYEWKNDGWESV